MEMSELMPGICDTTPPMRWSIELNMLRWLAKSSRVAYAWLRGVLARDLGALVLRCAHYHTIITLSLCCHVLERLVHHAVRRVYPRAVREQRVGLGRVGCPVVADT
jgi:hypothetical protein